VKRVQCVWLHGHAQLVLLCHGGRSLPWEVRDDSGRRHVLRNILRKHLCSLWKAQLKMYFSEMPRSLRLNNFLFTKHIYHVCSVKCLVRAFKKRCEIPASRTPTRNKMGMSYRKRKRFTISSSKFSNCFS